MNKKGVLKKDIEGQLGGSEGTVKKIFKAGRPVRVERSRLYTNLYVIWLGGKYYTKVEALDLPDTVDFMEK
jgi:hypothetical protein